MTLRQLIFALRRRCRKIQRGRRREEEEGIQHFLNVWSASGKGCRKWDFVGWLEEGGMVMAIMLRMLWSMDSEWLCIYQFYAGRSMRKKLLTLTPMRLNGHWTDAQIVLSRRLIGATWRQMVGLTRARERRVS